jgi:hypothetical protein
MRFTCIEVGDHNQDWRRFESKEKDPEYRYLNAVKFDHSFYRTSILLASALIAFERFVRLITLNRISLTDTFWQYIPNG